jgi:hypothetical protein
VLSGERSAVCAREAHLLLASQQGHEYSLLCCTSMYLGLYSAYQVARDWVDERGRQGAGAVFIAHGRAPGRILAPPDPTRRSAIFSSDKKQQLPLQQRTTGKILSLRASTCMSTRKLVSKHNPTRSHTHPRRTPLPPRTPHTSDASHTPSITSQHHTGVTTHCTPSPAPSPRSAHLCQAKHAAPSRTVTPGPTPAHVQSHVQPAHAPCRTRPARVLTVYLMALFWRRNRDRPRQPGQERSSCAGPSRRGQGRASLRAKAGRDPPGCCLCTLGR